MKKLLLVLSLIQTLSATQIHYEGQPPEHFVIRWAFQALCDHVHDPRTDGLDDHFRALPFQEPEHVEVAVTLGGLRPEFTGDFNDRFDAEPIDFDLVESPPHLAQRL